jgi:AcrR family transcriptional regulator
VRKGEVTRQAILEQAASLASQVGLEGLTIGSLAEALELSKSGLFAHFRSKEALQIQLLDYAVERFVDKVVRPALAAPRGEPRLRALFERWLEWSQAASVSGCILVALSTELDDQPGPARDRLVQAERDWLDVMATCFRTGVAEGHFSEDVDPQQFAYDFKGIMLAHHHTTRLLRDPKATQYSRNAFEALLATARRPRQ